MADDPVNNARAALEQVKTVTLPKIYREIGRRVAKSPKVPAALKHHFDAIARLKPAADAQDAAAVAQLREAYAALGRDAVALYGEKAIPKDIAPLLADALEKQKLSAALLQRVPVVSPATLKAPERHEIDCFPTTPTVSPGKSAPRVRRRRPGLAYRLIGGLAAITVVGVAAVVLWPSLRRGEKSATVASAHGGVTTGAPRKQSKDSSASTSDGYSGGIDRAVLKTLGKPSSEYGDYGLAGVELGQTYEQVTAKIELPIVHRMYPFKFMTAESDQYFVFDAQKRLRVYGKKYNGGPAENGEVVRRAFGRTGNQMINRVFKSSQSRTDSNMFIYTFPKVIALVEFRTTRFINYGQVDEREETELVVLDRKWALPMLHKSASIKRPVIEWMKLAADRVAIGKCDDAVQHPPKDVSLIAADDARPCRNWTLVEKSNAKEQVRMGRVRTVSPEDLKHVNGKDENIGVAIDFNRFSRLAGDVFLLDDGSEPSPADAIHNAPVLGLLDVEVTLQLLQEYFPPQSGKYNYVPEEQGGVTVGPGYYEWSHVTSSNAVFEVTWNTSGWTGAFFVTRPGL